MFQIAAAKPTPPKSQVTLTKEFPVSSGSQHRKKEADSVYGEWVPVEKNGEENKDDDNVFSSNLPSEVSKRNIVLFCFLFLIPESPILLLLYI